MSVSLPARMLRDLQALCALAIRSGAPALAVGAERFWRQLASRRKPLEDLPEQLPLWDYRLDGSLEPWRGRLGPDVPIRCDRFGQPRKPAIIPLKTCLQRQDSKWPGKKAAIHEFCGSGKCAQGAEYKLRAAYSAAADWASKSKAGKSSYQFYRRDAGVQRQRRRELIRSNLDRVPSLDEPPWQAPRPEPLDQDDTDVQELVKQV